MWVQSLGQEDSPGGGHGKPLQYSFLENPMDRKKSLEGLSIGSQRVRHDSLYMYIHTHTHTHTYMK